MKCNDALGTWQPIEGASSPVTSRFAWSYEDRTLLRAGPLAVTVSAQSKPHLPRIESPTGPGRGLLPRANRSKGRDAEPRGCRGGISAMLAGPPAIISIRGRARRKRWRPDFAFGGWARADRPRVDRPASWIDTGRTAADRAGWVQAIRTHAIRHNVIRTDTRAAVPGTAVPNRSDGR